MTKVIERKVVSVDEVPPEDVIDVPVAVVVEPVVDLPRIDLGVCEDLRMIDCNARLDLWDRGELLDGNRGADAHGPLPTSDAGPVG